ncbi:short-chain dehydrogenase [Lottiidibacillus patelloidae]|uniref:Short-chain dehydrogenase n=1 Tax=Lottiidibacillus patelloidae TaxID=2670334 RepID=A0A263BU45_9BACI|nr:SDR family oxidoreductase [Lottiidibacillus patelloidae]OZM57062.1 short-chain dehydrogenase [Lottiidibacillus patelloidae]
MKHVIITGAGSGLGAELAKLYACKGFHIILLGRTKSRLEKAKNEIEELRGKATIFTCNVANYADVERVIEEIAKQFPSINGVINNAGVGYFGNLEQLTEQEINEMIDTNVKGTIYLTSKVLPLLRKAEQAKIMNIISTAGLRGKVNESVYVASKFAVRGFTESLVKEFADTNIAVTAVYMGGMSTPFWEGSNHIKDSSRLKDPKFVAEKIINEDNGQPEIFIDR